MSVAPRREAARRVELAEWRTLPAVDREAVVQLEISAEQIEYAGTITRSIAACEAGDPAEVAGLVIRADGAIAGWLLVKRGASAPDWVGADAVVLSGLRIDRRQQGRGIGALALAELARWVVRHWPRSARLVLRVDDGNVAGIRAYEKAGWREVGERRVGRVGVERTMVMALR
ncbi:MAG TPA: GNAT family N-acetyltransferase [Burkholderiaceae bacterium]